MSYQVLARKWRPQIFSDLIGQEHVATTLRNALKSGRMPHALLFTGARGVGKTSAARILAKSLRCQNAVDFVPCNECVDCVEITSGRAVDVLEIDGASNNSVENIRDLRATVGYMPSRGTHKIYIIDEVHMLSTSAFNALLKTLEEPPPQVIFIFATTEPHKIPVTILSRCQRFDFRRIPIRKVAEHLKTIVEKEGLTAEQQALWLIARESEGSMRDSQSLLDQVITFSQKEITLQKVVDVLGLTDRSLLSSTLKTILEQNPQGCLNVIDKVFHHGYDPKQFAQDLLEHIRNLMIVKVSGSDLDGDFLDLPDNEMQELKDWAKGASNEHIHFLFDMALKGISDVVRALDPRIVLEMLLLRMTQAPRIESVTQILANRPNQPSGPPLSNRPPSAPQSQVTSPKADETSVRKMEPVTKAAIPEQAVSNDPWTSFLSFIKKERPLLAAKLEYSILAERTSEKVVIGFKKDQEFLFNQVNSPESIKLIQSLAAPIFGASTKVEIRLLSTTRASSQQASHEPAKEVQLSEKEKSQIANQKSEDEILKKIESHPLVRETKSQFNTKIKAIKETP